MKPIPPFAITPEQAGQTLAAVLRPLLPGLSWKQVRAVIAERRVKVRAELCLDDARRLKEGDTVELLAKPAPKPKQPELIVIRHLDEDIVVVEKPSGISTMRHRSEREWSEDRKALSPTLEDLVPKIIANREGRPSPRLRIVHRLDKETSGLLVMARTVVAERMLGKQFHAHTVTRRYLALIPGTLPKQTICTHLVRDRGDGRRGSGERSTTSKEATTHVEPVEVLGDFQMVQCRLETGRTHQIRIHLAEAGHPVCGDRVYCQLPQGGVFADNSGAPRLALHAAELGLKHPTTQEHMRWEMPFPADLQRLVEKLRKGGR
jgi:23S rRNA pseudouridine1911/1915/1917 synthase